MKKKKLAIVAHNINYRGGMEIHLSEVIARVRKDYDITVIATELTGEFPDIKFIKIPILQKPVFIKSVMFAILASLVLLLKKFDFVHTTGAIVFNRVDLSTVHLCHRAYNSLGLNDRLKYTKSFAHKVNSWLHGKFSLFMEGFCYRPNHIPQLVVVSDHVKKEIRDHFNYKEENITVIHNGVDIERYNPPSDHEKILYKNELGISEDNLVFVFVGGNWSMKGLRVLLEAFESLLIKYPDLKAKLLVVGKGDRNAITKGLNKETINHVIFKGFQENPSKYYKLSDIYVLPSSYETFSIASLEAAACGVPVIMTQVGISNLVAVNDITGYTVEKNKDSLLTAFEKLVFDTSLRAKMSQQIRKRSESITWDKTYESFKAHYRKLIKIT